MLRAWPELGLQDVDLEAETCRERLLALRGEFRKMEETVASMKRYKAKIDQLKQENTNVKLSYEANLQKYCSHISALERDNILLRNHAKKMEAQIHGKGDDRDKSRLLLERLKMVETENSSLVLENEQQRQHYEKCLDDIANQVVQALLAQKTLREECLKLQSRVEDLEMQNRHLMVMFKQKMKLNSDFLPQIQQTSKVMDQNVSGKSCGALPRREITETNINSTAVDMQRLTDELMRMSVPSLEELNLPGVKFKREFGLRSDFTSNSFLRTATESLQYLALARPATSCIAGRTRFKHSGRRARSLEHTSTRRSPCERMADTSDLEAMQQLHSIDQRCFSPFPCLKRYPTADDIRHFGSDFIASSSQKQSQAGNFQWNNFLSSCIPASCRDTLKQNMITSVYKGLPNIFTRNCAIDAATCHLKSAVPWSLSQKYCSSVLSEYPLTTLHTKASVAGNLTTNQNPQSATVTNQHERNMKSRRLLDRPMLGGELRNPSQHASKSLANVQDNFYYYDYSDDDSDCRPVYKDSSLMSALSLTELLDSTDKETTLDDDVFTDSSSVCSSPRKTSDKRIAVAVSSTGTAAANSRSAAAKSLCVLTTNRTVLATNGTALVANGTALATNRTALAANGTALATNRTALATNGTALAANGTALAANGTALATNGTALAANGTVVSKKRHVALSNGTVASSNKSEPSNNGTVASSNKSEPSNYGSVVSSKASVKPGNGAVASSNGHMTASNGSTSSFNEAVVSRTKADPDSVHARLNSLGSESSCHLGEEASSPVCRRTSSLRQPGSKKKEMARGTEVIPNGTAESTAANPSAKQRKASQITVRKQSAPTRDVAEQRNDKPSENVNAPVASFDPRIKGSLDKAGLSSSSFDQKPKGKVSEESKSKSSQFLTSRGQIVSSSDSCSGNERATRVVNRDTTGSRLASREDNPGESKLLTRPGQLILAPEEKNFIFQGFSSASSTSSEDKSPMKIFESKQNCDMRSSVIEVRKDGTFVHAMRSIEDSSSESSKSVSLSPSSPAKSPSKCASSVAKPEAAILTADTRTPLRKATDKTGKQYNCPGQENRNITVGFIFQNQTFPEQTDFEVVKKGIQILKPEHPSKCPPGKAQEVGSHIASKCQSSDSSFENLRVERSGSKDDGYSTMSSDIHPEILERFSDTLTRKQSAVDPDHPVFAMKSLVTETYFHQNNARRNSDPAVNAQDRSFDLTSDPDSALETSVHSTAEMVTSSSSQVSTSSSDFPLSPSSTNVSKMSRLFDVDGTKLRFVRAGVISIPKDKESPASSSSKIAASSLSPLSPNSFVPSCYQPPESPRRLANEFHKANTIVSPGSSATFRKLSPGSPKHLNKSFGGFSLKQKEQTSGIPAVSLQKKSTDTKMPSLAKPQAINPSLPNDQTRNPKVAATSTTQGARGKSLSLPKVKSSGKVDTNYPTKTENVSTTQVNLETVLKTKVESEKMQKHTLVGPSKITGEPSGKSDVNIGAGNGETISAGLHGVGRETNRKCLPKIYATPTSNIILSSSGNVSAHLHEKKTVNTSSPPQAADGVCSVINMAFTTLPDSCKSPKIVQNCLHDSKTVKHKHNASAQHKPVNSSPKESEPTSGPKTHITSRPSNLATKRNTRTSVLSSLRKTLSPSADPSDSLSSKGQLRNSQQSIKTTTDPTAEPTPRQCGRIRVTNNGFQLMSDSENTEDDFLASGEPVTVVDNTDDNQIKDSAIFNCNKMPKLKHGSCSVQTSNISTTNVPSHERTPNSATSQHSNVVVCDITDLTDSQTAPLLESAHPNRASASSPQLNQRHQRRHISSSLSSNKPNITQIKNSNKTQCLGRSRSESDLVGTTRTMSPHGRCCLWATWDCGAVLERCVSEREVMDLNQQSQSFQRQNSKDGSCQSRPGRQSHHRLQQDISSAPSPPSSFVFPSSHRSIHPQRHHCHSQGPRFISLKYVQLKQPDDLELDDFRPKLASCYDFMSSSQLDFTSDESPRTDVDEQKEFNSQFYSLCKVDSSRSLMSSETESREHLPEIDMDERTGLKRVDKTSGSQRRTSSAATKCSREATKDKEMDVEEFEEISRQIVSLSRTVEELNKSLSNFSSDDVQLPVCSEVEGHPQRETGTTSRPDVIEGYHWENDAAAIISSSREYVIRDLDVFRDESLAQVYSRFSPLDQSNTEDASKEFCQVSFRKQNKPGACRSLTGQDEIFAQTLFDTVKEKPRAERRSRQVWRPDAREQVEWDVSGDVEGRLASAVFRRMFQNGDVGLEGGDNGKRDVKDDESMLRQVCDEQGSDLADKLASSNNESDDSLASDIGLDRIMCQRLFGRKDCSRSSTNDPQGLIDDPSCYMSREELDMGQVQIFYLPTTWPDCGYRVRRSEKSMCAKGKEPILPLLKHVISDDDIGPWQPPMTGAMFPGDTCQLQTRDVGIDAMSQSQISMEASFEFVDQSLTAPDKKDIRLEPRNLDQQRNANSSQQPCNTFRNVFYDNHHVAEIGTTKRLVDCDDLLTAFTQDCIALDNSQSCGLEGQIYPDTACDITSYSGFIADLPQPSDDDEAAPPELPPRQPIKMNFKPIHCQERDIAPLPPPPVCLNNEAHPPSTNQHQLHHQQKHHLPYVNQFIPSLTFQNSGRYKPGKLKEITLSPYHHRSIASPPPLPPRLPHASNYTESVPQENTRQCRENTPNGNFDERPQSLSNYLLGKSKAALPSHSTMSPLATYPGPRSHSGRRQQLRHTSSTDKPKDEAPTSRIPRRRLRTRRDRSMSRLKHEKASGDILATSASTNSSPTCRQWRDISLVSGQPMSDNSCEDTSS